jgi:hypothetical protein
MKKTLRQSLSAYLTSMFENKSVPLRMRLGVEELYPLMSREDIRYVAKEICRSAVRDAK